MRITAKGSAVTLTYGAFEVFEIAEQVERNGAKFYRTAAELAGNMQVREIFLLLAEWEVRHEKIFSRMKQAVGELNTEPAKGKSGEIPVEPKAMAGLAVFSIKSRPGWELPGDKSQAYVLRMAMKNERDTVVFYEGLKSFVPVGAEQEKIDEIIGEEMRHISILERLLNKTD